jgi:hypothetical protein
MEQTPNTSNAPSFDGSNFNIDQMSRLIEEVGTNVEPDEVAPATEETSEEKVETQEEGHDALSESLEVEDSSDDEEKDEIEEDAEKPEEPESKLIKAKKGDKEFSVPEDAVVPVKVNGKITQVPIKDLAADYSGRTEIQKRFTQLDNERKTYEKERDSFVTHKNEISAHLQLMATLEPDEFIHHLATLKGEDPDELYGRMVQKTVELINTMAEMTPEVRKIYNENRKYKIQQALAQKAKELNESSTKKTKEQEAKDRAKQQVFSQMEKLEITQDEFFAAGEKMATLIDEGKIEGNFNEYDILEWAREEKVLTLIDDTVKVELPKATTEYKKNLRKALKAEEAYLGRYLTTDEISAIVERLIKDDRTAVKKNLSTKADTATSQRARSKTANTKDEKLVLSDFMRFMGRV